MTSRDKARTCPVCNSPYPAQAEVCPTCGWRLYSDTPLFLSEEEIARYRRQLEHERRAWQETHRGSAGRTRPREADRRLSDPNLTVVNCLAYSPDGELLAVGGSDPSLHLWQVRGEQRQPAARLTRTRISALAFSPSGELAIASGGWVPDNRLRILEFDGAEPRGKPTVVLPAAEQPGFPGAPLALAWSRDGALLAGSCAGWVRGSDSVWLWRRGMPAQLDVLATPFRGLALAFSPRVDLLAIGSGGWGSDCALRLWHLDQGAHAREVWLDKQEAAIGAISFSPDGQLIAAATSDGKVRLWEIADLRALAPLQGHIGPVNALAFSPDGRLLASGGNDHAVRVWSLNDPGRVLHLLDHKAPITALAFNPTGTQLVSGAREQHLRLWRVTD